MKKIGIIDYDCGNLFSLGNALKKIGKEFSVVTNPRELSRYDLVILPGVGSFGPAVKHLTEIGFADEIHEFHLKNREIVGICLGMQLLLSKSYELGVNTGLGFIKGSVRKIPQSTPQARIPNIGWSVLKRNSSFKGEVRDKLEQFAGKHFYFVHSYHACPDNSEQISHFVSFGDDKLAAMVCVDNLTGVQFHPEISGAYGLKLLRTIVER